MGSIKAVFWDMDGVIIDTERDGHRVAFNMTFKEMGFSDKWSVEEYHELLQIGGGKERMKHYWQTKGFSKPIPADQIDSVIKQMHELKTQHYIDLLKQGKLPLRPGVHRFMQEIVDAGLKLAMCTTSNELAAKAVVDGPLADIHFDEVLAGDLVKRKKPDPEIYNLALARFNLRPDEAFAVEDSRNGVLAAKAARLRVLVTTNGYTEQEDVSAGDIIVTCLGDSPADGCKLKKGDIQFGGVLELKQVLEYFSR